ncbi:uncharacterized protein LOC125084395 [Lutra lutra]|uniref:uncharacterized protein LOC125084395 n=1 Tax=Lutra lutra TaxID=9657 RepID=UPI001FD18630|nr:uncharacterized protein LOC125084395 [Lutra lutra]
MVAGRCAESSSRKRKLLLEPTWDDRQQLLQVLFTTEEREQIQVEAQKSVLGDDRQPTQNSDLINAAFPLSHPAWDYNSAEDTFSGWTEAFPTKHETAQTVTKKLLEDILLRYGFIIKIGSDNGSGFISKVTQGVALVLGADWKLHCAYRPQSSGQVERMNRPLKETLTKLALETGRDWVTLLPFTLYRVRNSPYKMGLTPYEIMFGIPSPIIPNLKPEVLAEFDDHQLLFSLQMLQRTHEQVWPKLRASTRPGHPRTPIDIGRVYVQRHQHQTLQPGWKGHYIVLLTTPTALKVDGITPWVHYTQVRPADPHAVLKDFVPEWKSQPNKDNPLKPELWRW